MTSIARATEEQTILESGSSDLRNGYLHTLLDPGDVSAGKAELRDKVINLVLSTCEIDKERPSRMICLPGPQWSVERELFRRSGNCLRFTAFETSLTLMHRGLINIPRFDEGLKRDLGWRQFTPARIAYFRTTAARWVHADFLDWCTLDEDFMLTRRGYADFNLWDYWLRKFWSYDCAWLDFTGCLSPKMTSALTRFPHLQGYDRERDKPVVVTVQKGREHPDTTKFMRDCGLSRAEFIRLLLDKKPGYRFEPLEEHEYRSQSGTTMLSLIGVYRRQPKIDHA
jgi:hypothetical protein